MKDLPVHGVVQCCLALGMGCWAGVWCQREPEPASVSTVVCKRNPKSWRSPSLSSLAVCSLVWPGHPITHLACTELDVTCHTENTLSLCVVSCAGLWASSLLTCFALAGPKKGATPASFWRRLRDDNSQRLPLALVLEPESSTLPAVALLAAPPHVA